MFLYIKADFDENGLISKMFTDVLSLSEYLIGEQLTMNEVFTKEDDDDILYLRELLLEGYKESEWWSEELYQIHGSPLVTQGLH